MDGLDTKYTHILLEPKTQAANLLIGVFQLVGDLQERSPHQHELVLNGIARKKRERTLSES